MARIFVTAGASGGHIFPAIATAQELQRRGHQVLFVLGGPKFAELVTAAEIPLAKLPAAPFNDRGWLGRGVALAYLAWALVQALRLLAQQPPAVVFSAGGYGSAALVFAAKLRGIPVVLNEQNVLPGRANRLLARFASRMLLTFEETRQYLPKLTAPLLTTGTPLRASLLAAANQPKPALPAGHFHLLVLGGSQGARILSEVVPEAVRHLTPAEQARFHLTQQVRTEDLARVEAQYAGVKLASLTLQPFFADMPARYQAASVLLGRSGTGTVLEAALFGLPAIYVPLELADGHQKLNAAVAERADAALVLPQAYFTPANLLVHLRALWQDEAKRRRMAQAARSLSRPDAVKAVADVIEELMGERE
ncbi:MAG: undecaprenyldiphospho-muramoylpentapeptide beta-N-acetylglucosaminyltransferase [Alphaproteobacteria bacterium]|nr:undecaprenyldiphospho-muramoylpentapeptide beta-N-acetylglucosaminyltransferase [Alphaproteobacteria bacterium]